MLNLKIFFHLQKSRKNKSSKSWFDSELQKLLDKKELFRLYIHQKTLLTKNAFNEARNICFKAIKKQAFFKQKFNGYKNDIKNNCRTVNSILGNKSKTNYNSLLNDGELKSEPQLLANHFSNHFTTVAHKP